MPDGEKRRGSLELCLTNGRQSIRIGKAMGRAGVNVIKPLGGGGGVGLG